MAFDNVFSLYGQAFNPYSFGGGGYGGYGGGYGGFGGFNFGSPYQFSNPRAAPSPYAHSPWGSGYFNDAARSGATGGSSPFSGGGYSPFSYGPFSFGGGFGGYNPFANPFMSYGRPSNPPYMAAPPSPTQPVKETPQAPGGGTTATPLESPGVRALSWNAMNYGGGPVMSQASRRAFGGGFLPYGGRQMVRY